MPSPLRFPPRWSVEDIGAAYVVKDNSGQKLAYVYYEEEPGRRSSAMPVSSLFLVVPTTFLGKFNCQFD